MPDAPTDANAVWTEGTDLREVIEYVTAAWENAIILYMAACGRSDPEAMQVCTRQMKHVVTRLDQFTRTRMRKWKTRLSQISHQETKRK